MTAQEFETKKMTASILVKNLAAIENCGEPFQEAIKLLNEALSQVCAELAASDFTCQ